MPMAFSQVRSTKSSSSLKMRLPEQEGELYVRRPYRKLDLWRIMDLISKRPKFSPLFVLLLVFYIVKPLKRGKGFFEVKVMSFIKS